VSAVLIEPHCHKVSSCTCVSNMKLLIYQQPSKIYLVRRINLS